MRFCVKCGRSLPKEELIRGMCVDCFKKHVNILAANPQVEVVICPKCGSWVSRGEWYPPAADEEIFQITLENTLRRYLIEGIDLLSVSVAGFNQLAPNVYSVSVILVLKIDEKTLYYELSLDVHANNRVCPTCISRAVGKYKYLIQVRFTTSRTSQKLLELVKRDIISSVKEGVVNIKEVREGLDVELEDAVIAKKVLETLSRYYGAKVISSFKQVGFDSRKGKPLGVVTYSVRIPVFSEGDIVVYKNKVAYIKSVERGKVVLWVPESDKYESLDVKHYWSGILKYPTRVEYEEYFVESIDSSGAVIVKSTDGETRRRIRLNTTVHGGLKPGSKVLLVRVDNNIEAFVS